MDDLKVYSRNEKELESLVQAICIFNEDTGMEFFEEKCDVSDRDWKDCEISCYRVTRWYSYQVTKVE